MFYAFLSWQVLQCSWVWCTQAVIWASLVYRWVQSQLVLDVSEIDIGILGSLPKFSESPFRQR